MCRAWSDRRWCEASGIRASGLPCVPCGRAVHRTGLGDDGSMHPSGDLWVGQGAGEHYRSGGESENVDRTIAEVVDDGAEVLDRPGDGVLVHRNQVTSPAAGLFVGVDVEA